MVIPAPRAIAPVFPAEVSELALEQGVQAYLPAIWEMTERQFPFARRLEVGVESDPEIANDHHIVFLVEAAITVAEAVEGEGQWIRGLYRCCPSTHVCVFRLDLRIIEE